MVPSGSALTYRIRIGVRNRIFVVSRRCAHSPADDPSAAIPSHPLKSSTTGLDAFSKSPYYVSNSTIQTLLATARDSLDKTTPYKNLVLCSPHSGSSIMLSKIVAALAKDLTAKVVTVDYQAILKAMSNVQLQNDSPNIAYLKRFDKHGNHYISEAFAPGSLEILDEEFDDMEDGDEDDHEGEAPRGKGSFSATMDRLSSKIIFQVKVPKELELAKGENRSPSSANTPLARSVPISKAFGQQTFYSQTIMKDFIIAFLEQFKNQITMKAAAGEETVVVYIQDVVDFSMVPHSCGKKIILGIMDVISELRENHAIQVMLIAGSSPALSLIDNHQKDLFFWIHLLEGIRSAESENGRTYETFNLITDGTIFNSNFEKFDDFEKIEVFPPSPVYQALNRKSAPAKVVRNVFLEYLDQMEVDQKARLKNINWCSILSFLGSRNVQVADLEQINSSIKSDVKRSEAEQILIETLESEIWSVTKVNRVGLLTIAAARQSNGLNTSIRKEDFLNALGLLYDGDLTRLPSMELNDNERVIVRSGDDPDGSASLNVEESNDSSHTAEDIPPKKAISHEDSINQQLKRSNVKLNTYEKRLLTTVVDPKNLQTSMSHLILQPKTKLLLQTLVTLPMLHPQLFQKGILSRSSINGVLLFGPPGTGKTMLAKALAKSSGAKFMAVSLSDIFDKYVGEGEKNVRAIFTLARKLSPCVIFLDEVDALFGARRQNESSASRREIMNEFMQEWDGIASNNDGIVVLGATNRPFDLDDAILRRMPRRVLVDLPSEKARKKILEVNLDGEALDDTIDIANLAKRTELYSGSDLKNMCVAAALAKVKDDLVSHHLGDSLKDISEVDQKALIQKRVSEIEDYSHVNDLTEIKISDLSLRHFEIALKEVGASLTDDTATLVELRKWDGIYGDGAKGRGKKPDWGFGYLKK